MHFMHRDRGLGRGVKTTSIQNLGVSLFMNRKNEVLYIYLNLHENDFITLLTHIIIPANFKLLQPSLPYLT